MRAGVVATAIGLSIVGLASAADAGAAIRKPTDIPAQELGAALTTLAKEFDFQVLYKTEVVGKRRTEGVSGSVTAQEALQKVLSGTGLTYKYLDEKTVMVMPVGAPAADKDRAGAETGAKEGKKDSSNGFRVAQLDQGKASSNSPSSSPVSSQAPSGTSDNGFVKLEQVVVTATKLAQPARKVAGSAAVTTGSQIDEIGAQSFADYLTRVPGVIFNASIPGLSTVTVRGVSTATTPDQGQGTTGYYINEVPLTDPNFTVAIPDIDTFDVDNVAVMRGPQGTLFGSASLGGAINYQAALPDPTRFQARLQGTFAGTAHGSDSGSGKGMVNIPLVTDQLAVRLVYLYRKDGGYIDNLGTGTKDASRTLVRGGRAEVLWTPMEGTRIFYMFLKQAEDTADNGYEEPDLAGPRRKRTLFPEELGFKTTLNNLRLDQDFGFATLTATATYHQKAQSSVIDGTLALGPLFANLLMPIAVRQGATSNGTTFEVRLASPADRRFTYLVGVMRDLTRESILDLYGAPGAQQYATAVFDPILGAGFGASAVPNDIFLTSTLGAKAEERALFGEGTFHFTDRWAATVGGRLFDTQLEGTTASSGLLEFLTTNPSTLTFSYASPQRSRGFTPKVSLTWTITPDFMVYALADKGFRFGGPNVIPPSATNPFPPTYSPDTLWNYEIGTRTNWLERRLQLDATAFYIDWSNIQVRLGTASGLAYTTNFGKARNYGLESTAGYRPVPALSLQGSVTYLNATLREPFKSGANLEPAGAVLPGASKWNVSGTVSYQWMGLPLQPSVLVSDRFISSAPGGFGFTQPQTQGNYNLLDARFSAYFKALQASVFVNNIADRNGVSNVQYPLGAPLERYLVRPRTVGLTLDYRY
ncbi:MAG TPA: TonB-dependent receptor [Steroidobacteraceae bacterium]|nr:TonB-dependent receptor [Steroidobacteraceae bacterium]